MIYFKNSFKDPSLIVSIISVIISSCVALYVMHSSIAYEEEKEFNLMLKEVQYLSYLTSGIYESISYFIEFKDGYDQRQKQNEKLGLDNTNYGPYYIQLESHINDELNSLIKNIKNIDRKSLPPDITDLYFEILNFIQSELKYRWESSIVTSEVNMSFSEVGMEIPNPNIILLDNSLGKLKIYIDELEVIYKEFK